MSLTRKVSSIVALVFLLSALANVITQQFFIMPSFIALEKETAGQNGQRVMGALDRELEQLAISASDWAYWTDTYNFAKGVMPEYVAENFNRGATLEAMKLNFLAIYDLSGKALWRLAIELESLEIIEIGQLTEKQVPADHPLLQFHDVKGEVKGIINTNHGPLLVVAKPILTTDLQGPAAGTLVMGRFLNDQAVDNIAKLTKLPVTLKPVDSKSVASAVPGVGQDRSGSMHTELSLIETAEKWQARSMLSDLFGMPLLELEVATARHISLQGKKAINQSLLVLAATGLMMMLVLWKLLQTTMLRPIEKLTNHALLIGENDALNVRLNPKGNDEFGVLGRTFDQMVDRLAETRRRLIEQSYHSGIAEMASGVLHNIGNAITPLNIRLAELQQQLKTAPLPELDQATRELADPLTAADRRIDLQQFVELVGSEMAALIKTGQQEIAGSIKAVGHVQEILADQQRFSRSARIIEPVDMAPLILDVAAGLTPDFKTALHLEISPSVTEIGLVAGSRAALQQVVANLMINSAESILSAGAAAGSLIVTAQYEQFHGRKMVGLSFVDNGDGIDPEHINQLFERGFSTKHREGSGFGLHWSANTIQALGGQILIESGGRGQGTTLRVLLPSAENLLANNSQKN